MKSFFTVLFVVYRVYLCESQGISAGTVFVLNGEDLHLNNLQEADSGEYTAVVTKLSGGETEAAKYKIKVQDRASLPLLTVSSVSRSSPSCSFTVTCSSQDSHINSTFTCDNQTCSQEGGERSEGIPDTFHRVHQSRGSIICNHSNHVSWTNTTKIIKDVCHQQDDPQTTTIVLITLGVCFAILAIVRVVLWCLRKRRTTKGASIENPVNDSVQREVRERSGRPVKMTARAQRRMLNEVKKNPRVSAET
ncbi:hypothetical protein JOQ06_001726 [Pogonophryne albipinna]|uniref:Immunoglobulin subtype domain-containing protein n=1 Tax=Pogonophryne albipinna TaxID=1090488 RepID=A0AAD6B6L6_9TELE|nr:hypothetical protein JOQ06_001726 [Pogonophryne albipinna]